MGSAFPFPFGRRCPTASDKIGRERSVTDPDVETWSGFPMTHFVGTSADTVVPIVWFSTVMHHCEEQNMVSFYRVQNTVWKCMRQTAPYLAVNLAPPPRLVNNTLDGAFNFNREARAETCLAIFVVRHRIEVLNTSLRMKCVTHYRLARRRASFRTSSPGIGSTLPDRTSARRRLASSSQSC